MGKSIIKIFTNLIEEFLQGKKDADDFRTEFILLRRKYFDSIVGEGSIEISKMFTAADSYCEDENLVNEYDINKKELLLVANEVYSNLLRH